MLKPTDIAPLVAYIGSYAAGNDAAPGGIVVLHVARDGRSLTQVAHVASPVEAGYLAYARDTQVLYAVDERKTDGRGPVHPPAAVHAFAVNPVDGNLTFLNSLPAPGPRPTYLNYAATRRLLLCANHGDFQHVEKVVQQADGQWVSHYVYDDSTVIVYSLADNGRLDAISDVKVFDGHGMDPNHSPQNGGHAQASPHAHCASITPDEAFVLVCDKGTDRIYVYRLGPKLEQVFVYQMPPETAPRHVAFGADGLVFVTLELSSEIAVMSLAPQSGALELIQRVSTLDSAYQGLNEPAEVRVHPNGRFVYVNNRGEDSLACFQLDSNHHLRRTCAVQLATSIHPGLAARSFSFDPTGAFMLVVDRPASLVRAYAVNQDDGSLAPIADIAVPEPAFVEFADLADALPHHQGG